MYKQPLSLPKGERVLWFVVGRKLLQWDVGWSWMPGLRWAKLFTEQHVTEDLPQIPCLVAPSLIRPAGQHRASPTSICSPGWGHSCGWHPGAQSLASLLPSLQALRVKLWALVYSVSPRKHLPATGKSHPPAGSTIITEEWQEGLVVSCSSSGNETVVLSLWLEIKLKPKGQPIYGRVVKRCQLHFDWCHDLTLLFLLSAAEWERAPWGTEQQGQGPHSIPGHCRSAVYGDN